MFQRSLPSFSVFLTYGFENLGQEVGHPCFACKIYGMDYLETC